MAHILEAVCGKCGETFNPYSEHDLEHVVRADGQFCEGQGELRGEWKPIAPLQGPPPDYDAMEAQAAYDDFWGRY